MTWFSISLGRRKPEPFLDNPLAAFEGRDLRTCQNFKTNLPRAKEAIFLFLGISLWPRTLFRRMQRQPRHAFIRPSTSRTTSSASLVVRHQCRGSRVFRRGRTIALPDRAQSSPQHPHAPRMRFGRHNNAVRSFSSQAPRQLR